MNKKQRKYIIELLRNTIIALLIVLFIFYLHSIYGDIIFVVLINLVFMAPFIWIICFMFYKQYKNLGKD